MFDLADASALAPLLSEAPTTGLSPQAALRAGYHAQFAEMSWQVLPSYAERLLEWFGPEAYIGLYPIAARAEAFRIFFRIQDQVLSEVVRTLTRAGLDYCLLKGTASRLNLYASADLRGGIDIDIAIPVDAGHEGRRLARSLGFVQSAWDERARTFVTATAEQRAWIDANHYELGFLIRRHAVEGLTEGEAIAIRQQMHLQPNPWHEIPDGGLGVWINLDLHTGLSHDIPAEPLMASSRAHQHRDFDVRIPSPAWQLFHTVYKLYWEGVFSYGKGIYQYADLCRLAPRLTSADVAEFKSLIERWRLEAAARYVLMRLQTDFRVHLPDALSELIASISRPPPHTKPQEENNFGDVWGKLWGFR